MVAAEWAFDQMSRGLREKIIFGRKPSFEAMIQFTAEIVDFYEFGARGRT